MRVWAAASGGDDARTLPAMMCLMLGIEVRFGSFL